jgi:hypothetical protein
MYRTLKFIVCCFGLDLFLVIEGSIMDFCFEILE